MNQTTTTTTAADLRAQADAHDAEAYASFQRCDTDGALSQWASGINAHRLRLEADIVDNGGLHEFWALFDLDGNWVPATVIDGRYGPCWMLLDENGGATGQFAPYRPARESTLERRGFREGLVLRPARASTKGGDSILSVRACVVPTTPGHVAPVAIVDNGTGAE
jgi:hypothetical protein